jgi:hypothetical protein
MILCGEKLNSTYKIGPKEHMLDIVEDFLDTHPDINYMTPEDCQAYIAA